MRDDPLPGWETCLACGGGGWRVTANTSADTGLHEVPCRACETTGVVIAKPADGLRFVPVIVRAVRTGQPYRARVAEMAANANAAHAGRAKGAPPKLTAQQAKEICIRRAIGERVAALAIEYRVSTSTIYQITNGKATAYPHHHQPIRSP